MATVEGLVTVYEASDGGTGSPAETFWQFFVFDPTEQTNIAVNTVNHLIAETMRLAIKTNNKVQVTYDDSTKKMSQARLALTYICESREIYLCDDTQPVTKVICTAERYSPCKPSQIPPD